MVCQLKEEKAALQSEVARARQEHGRIELEAQQKAERERLRQEEMQTLLARISLASDDRVKGNVLSIVDVIDVIYEVEEWLAMRRDANESSVSSNSVVNLSFLW